MTLPGQRLSVWMVEELTAYVTWLNQQGVSTRGEGRKTSLAALVSLEGHSRRSVCSQLVPCFDI